MYVYAMRMARVNIYLPDDLAEKAKAADLNVSGLAQEAIRRQLRVRETNQWLDRLLQRPPTGVPPTVVAEALAAARAELAVGLEWEGDD